MTGVSINGLHPTFRSNILLADKHDLVSECMIDKTDESAFSMYSTVQIIQFDALVGTRLAHRFTNRQSEGYRL